MLVQQAGPPALTSGRPYGLCKSVTSEEKVLGRQGAFPRLPDIFVEQNPLDLLFWKAMMI